MTSDERILQVLENSACLRKTQLLAYLNRELFPEELRVVEIHLAECGLCNEALEGLDRSGNARALIDKLQPPELPVAEDKIAPAAAATASRSGIESVRATVAERSAGLKEKLPARRRNSSWLGAVGIAALLLIGFGLIWQFELKHKSPSELIPTGAPPPLAEPEQEMRLAGVGDSLPEAATSAGRPGSSSSPAALSDSASGKTPLGDTAAASAVAAVQDDSLSQAAGQRQLSAAPRDSSKVDEKKVADTEKVASAPAPKPASPRREAPPAQPTGAGSVEDLKTARPAPLSDFETGVDLYKKKQYASALLYLKSAASDESDPRHWDAVYYSALCNMRLNKTGRAKRLFRTIIRAGAPQKSAAEKQLESISGTPDEE